jgi:hypothetical protein
MEGVAASGGSHSIAQQIDFSDQQIAAAVAQIHGKEVSRAWHTSAVVIGHGGSSLSGTLPETMVDKLRVVHPTKPNLRRVENREAFSAVDARATCCVGFVVLSASAALSSAFGYRFRLARRVPFGRRPKRNQKVCAPASGPACGGVPSLHHCSRGPPRRAIPGPSRLSRHPCRSTPCVTIPLGLLKGAIGVAWRCVQLVDKLRVVHPTKANLRRVENREAFSTKNI